MKRHSVLFHLVFLAASAAWAEGWNWDAGADLRIRQELFENIPGLPGTLGMDGQRHGSGVLMPAVRGQFTDHMRFRARVWGEVKAGDNWRIYTRLTDEPRWSPEPYKNAHTFPDELVLDNLFLEGKNIFDGLMNVLIGRRDLYNLYGLDHVFVDGTPGDGSRTTYGDIVQLGFQFTKEERLDLFFLHNCDRNNIRWGTDRSDIRSMTGYGGDSDRGMDDWGAGAIWSGKAMQWLDYQAFAMDKTTQGFHRDGISHPWTSRAMAGFKLVPHLNEEWSVPLEAMGQAGKNGDGDFLSGWSTYSGVHWKSVRQGWKPYGSLGFHTMSGDSNAGEEDGGHCAWDPMWARGVNDSELFLYGTHYGQAWWSNQLYTKLTTGVDLGHNHKLSAHIGPMWAAAQDGMGGGSGMFKGLLSQLRYDFPIWSADRAKGERFEVFGHFLAEFFNPGDYFETDKPAYFIRWQVDFKF